MLNQQIHFNYDQSNYFSYNSQDLSGAQNTAQIQMNYQNGEPQMDFRKGTRPNLDLLNGNLGKIPQEKINLSLQHPECRAKPEINNVSKILAQGKRSNEPVHERLFKQDILSKKIAVELEAKRETDSKSRERSRPKSKQVTRERSRGELF